MDCVEIVRSMSVISSNIDRLTVICNTEPNLPREFRAVGRALPSFYEALWKCELPIDVDSANPIWTSEVLIALAQCEASSLQLHTLIAKGVSVASGKTRDPVDGLEYAILDTYSCAVQLLRQMYVSLSTLPRVRTLAGDASRVNDDRPRLPQKARLHRSQKYVSYGAGAQYNSVNEGKGRQDVSNAHGIRDASSAHTGRECEA